MVGVVLLGMTSKKIRKIFLWVSFFCLAIINLFLYRPFEYLLSGRSVVCGVTTKDVKHFTIAAEVTSYPSIVRTIIIRKYVAEKIDFMDLDFSPLSNANQEALKEGDAFWINENKVSIYSAASEEAMEDGEQGQWFFNAEFEMMGLGEDKADDIAGNEIIAFLPGVKLEICQKINSELGLPPDIQIKEDVSHLYTRIMAPQNPEPEDEYVLGDEKSSALFEKPFGCFQNGDGTHVYYHVLVER